MAADTGKIFACKGCSIGGAVDGVVFGRINYIPVSRRDNIGKKSVVTDADVIVEVYGNNPKALLAKLATSAGCVFSVLRDDGSTGTETLTSVDWTEPLSSAEIPEADGGGKLASFGIRGHVSGTAALATKWVSA